MFGIEIDNVLLMEIGLNALGYFAAGALSLMFYNAVTKRRWRRMFAEIIEQSAEIVAINNAANASANTANTASDANTAYTADTSGLTAQEEGRGSSHYRAVGGSSGGFVSFAEQDRLQTERIDRSSPTFPGDGRREVENAVSEYRSSQNYGMQDATGSVARGDYTRNRSDVIRLAKEMLESGRTSESVRNALPISDSEMRLVEIGSRR